MTHVCGLSSLLAQVSTFHDQFLFEPRSAWTYRGATYPAGSLVAVGIDDWFKHGQAAAAPSATFAVTLLFAPEELKSSMQGFAETQSLIVVNVLEHVRGVRASYFG